jgi:hypothetical protein
LEFLGKNTLETYVLQFHLFMNHKVQEIPIVIPGSGPDGHVMLKVLNMLLCGTIFVAVAVLARKVTVSTQNTVTELVTVIRKRVSSNGETDEDDDDEGDQEMMKPMVVKAEPA